MFRGLFKKKKIEVTPNVEHCLNVFKKVAQSLPEGKEKNEVEGAVHYLIDTATGKKQPHRGVGCGSWFIAPLLKRDDEELSSKK